MLPDPFFFVFNLPFFSKAIRLKLSPNTNAIKVLLACIYKSVNTSLFLKALVATSIVKFKCSCLFPFLSMKYLAVKYEHIEFGTLMGTSELKKTYICWPVNTSLLNFHSIGYWWDGIKLYPTPLTTRPLRRGQVVQVVVFLNDQIKAAAAVVKM